HGGADFTLVRATLQASASKPRTLLEVRGSIRAATLAHASPWRRYSSPVECLIGVTCVETRCR
ncbi:MAG: hypothetical protein PVJ86_09145, partial [Phycisphaerales bacterium]